MQACECKTPSWVYKESYRCTVCVSCGQFVFNSEGNPMTKEQLERLPTMESRNRYKRAGASVVERRRSCAVASLLRVRKPRCPGV